MVIYSFIGSLINMIALSKYINYSLFEQIKDILIPLFGSLLMIGIIYIIKLPFANMLYVLLIQILIGVLTYLLVILTIKPKGYLFLKKLLFKGGN